MNSLRRMDSYLAQDMKHPATYRQGPIVLRKPQNACEVTVLTFSAAGSHASIVGPAAAFALNIGGSVENFRKIGPGVVGSGGGAGCVEAIEMGCSDEHPLCQEGTSQR